MLTVTTILVRQRHDPDSGREIAAITPWGFFTHIFAGGVLGCL